MLTICSFLKTRTFWARHILPIPTNSHYTGPLHESIFFALATHRFGLCKASIVDTPPSDCTGGALVEKTDFYSSSQRAGRDLLNNCDGKRFEAHLVVPPIQILRREKSIIVAWIFCTFRAISIKPLLSMEQKVFLAIAGEIAVITMNASTLYLHSRRLIVGGFNNRS